MPQRKRAVSESPIDREEITPGKDEKPLEIEMFQQVLAQTSKEFSTYIYRYDKYAKGKRLFLRKIVGELPDIDEIAGLFGGGDYTVICQYKNQDAEWKARRFDFSIDKTIHNIGSDTPAPGQAPQNFIIPQNSESLIKGIKEIAALLIPLFVASKKAANNNGSSFYDDMRGMGDFMKNIMKDVFAFQLEAQNDILKLRQESTDPAPSEPSQLEGILKIVNMVKEFYPALVSPAGGNIINRVKQDTQYQELVSSPEKMKAVITKMTKELGKEKAYRVLKMFGIVPK